MSNIKQLNDTEEEKNFKEKTIVFILQVIDELPPEMRSLLKMAVDLPPVARAALSGGLAALGVIILIGALCCLARAAKRQEKLHLSNPLPANTTNNKTGQLNPAFQTSK